MVAKVAVSAIGLDFDPLGWSDQRPVPVSIGASCRRMALRSIRKVQLAVAFRLNVR